MDHKDGDSGTSVSASPRQILVTGATGYIGGRLVPRLVEKGYQVRCLLRDPARVAGRPWLAAVECVTADVLETDTLMAALEQVDVAYYLVHSLRAGAHYHERDMRAATHFAAAARAACVRRIVYLGGLADADAVLSTHLRSRQQTGNALRTAGVPVTEFRASVIVGSGSISFEIIRYLTDENGSAPLTEQGENLPGHCLAAGTFSRISSFHENTRPPLPSLFETSR